MLYPKTYQETVVLYQEKYGIEGNLIFAVIKAESNFDKDAISNRNAIGLMQLMEEITKFMKIYIRTRQITKNGIK